jgi:hypothetical protein
MRPLLALTALALAVLAGCGPAARMPPMARTAAQADTQIRTLRVVAVFDQVEKPLDDGRDIFVSHYLDVDVVAGPDVGASLTLPFDERYAGRPVPRPGDTITAAPADLVPRAPSRPGQR